MASWLAGKFVSRLALRIGKRRRISSQLGSRANRSRRKQQSRSLSNKAGERFLADAKARQLNESTVYKYQLLFKQLGDFAKRTGIQYLTQLDLQALDQFRSEWHEGPRSSLKKLERLRAFFRFSERRKWIDSNPGTELKAPRVANRPTLPFTREEKPH